MAISLYMLGVALWLGGGFVFISASTSIIQTIGALIGVSGSVLFGAGAIVNAIQDAQLVIETRILQAVKGLNGDPASESAQE